MAKTNLDKFLESANEAFKEAYKLVTPDMLPSIVRHSFTEEEERRIAEEQRRAADIERTAQRAASLVVGALARSHLEAPVERPKPEPQLSKPVEQPTGSLPDDDDSSTVDEFCRRNKISRSTLYKMWRNGTGPAFMKHGKSTRIIRRAERLWQRQRESESLRHRT
jgi:hypothetical protein